MNIYGSSVYNVNTKNQGSLVVAYMSRKKELQQTTPYSLPAAAGST